MKPANVSAPFEGEAAAEVLVDAKGNRYELARDHVTQGRARLRRKVFAGGPQSHAARRLGVSPQRLHGVLSTHRPDVDFVGRAAIVYGIEAWEWVVAPIDTSNTFDSDD